ncbi:MAG: UDP-3-O-[3-hydroxymyristoyl] glucosamine N-acyltransferase [Oceanospirillaceae bacterium]
MFSVAQIASFLQADVIGDKNLRITNLAPLSTAEEGAISFCAQKRSLPTLRKCKASAVLVTATEQSSVLNSAIVVDDPYLAFAKISQWFDWRTKLIAGVADSSVIAESAKVASSAQLCHGVVVGENSSIGENCYIGPNAVIAGYCVIEANTRIEAGVVLYQDVKIGENCHIHANAVIGADGFGFAKKAVGWQKICQLGGVRIGRDVEIGASTTVDRGAMSNTIIGDGVKLDNQIQIGHNVHLGNYSAVAASTAIAGSTNIGENCTIAGMCGIAGHIDITAGTHITGMSMVSNSIKKAGIYSSGTGTEEHHSWKRNVVRFRSLDTIAKRIKVLEGEVRALSLEENKGKV